MRSRFPYYNADRFKCVTLRHPGIVHALSCGRPRWWNKPPCSRMLGTRVVPAGVHIPKSNKAVFAYIVRGARERRRHKDPICIIVRAQSLEETQCFFSLVPRYWCGSFEPDLAKKTSFNSSTLKRQNHVVLSADVHTTTCLDLRTVKPLASRMIQIHIRVLRIEYYSTIVQNNIK